MAGARTILTGPSGSGKTALCLELADRARAASLDVGGVACPGRWRDAAKAGIDALDLRTRATRELAWRNDPARPGTVTIGTWTFDADALRWGDDVLRAATPCDLLIVDELGPLEFEQQRGWLAGLGALEAGRFAHAIAVVRTSLAARALARWPAAALVHTSDSGTRARLAGQLAALARTGPSAR